MIPIEPAGLVGRRVPTVSTYDSRVIAYRAEALRPVDAVHAHDLIQPSSDLRFAAGPLGKSMGPGPTEPLLI